MGFSTSMATGENHWTDSQPYPPDNGVRIIVHRSWNWRIGRFSRSFDYRNIPATGDSGDWTSQPAAHFEESTYRVKLLAEKPQKPSLRQAFSGEEYRLSKYRVNKLYDLSFPCQAQCGNFETISANKLVSLYQRWNALALSFHFAWAAIHP
jgi:hypothetical protein